MLIYFIHASIFCTYCFSDLKLRTFLNLLMPYLFMYIKILCMYLYPYIHIYTCIPYFYDYMKGWFGCVWLSIVAQFLTFRVFAFTIPVLVLCLNYCWEETTLVWTTWYTPWYSEAFYNGQSFTQAAVLPFYKTWHVAQLWWFYLNLNNQCILNSWRNTCFLLYAACSVTGNGDNLKSLKLFHKSFRREVNVLPVFMCNCMF